eukprot:6208181-Pleurochrysis_carterae.AAC.1
MKSTFSVQDEGHWGDIFSHLRGTTCAQIRARVERAAWEAKPFALPAENNPPKTPKICLETFVENESDAIVRIKSKVGLYIVSPSGYEAQKYREAYFDVAPLAQGFLPGLTI